MDEGLKPEIEVKLENIESEPVVNLLKDYDGALQAIGEIEGEAWKTRQSVDSGYTLTSALKNLKREMENRGQDEMKELFGILDFTVYGSGGMNRYIVRSDGSVWFHRGFIDGSLGIQRRGELLEKIKNLGIGLFGG